MALFDALFGKPESKTVALIDLTPVSVAGAFAHYKEGSTPLLLYTRRLPVTRHRDEAPEDAMLRALTVLGEALVREGGPVALRATGSGSPAEVLVSIDAPWQEVSVRTERIERDRPFTFTDSLVRTVLDRTRTEIVGKKLSNESIIGTTLNGYETRKPYGKKAQRATLIILTSYIDEAVVDTITEQIQGFFHVRNVRSVAACSLRSEAIRGAFPHESDALMLDISSVAISVALIRGGFLAAVTTLARNPHQAAWVPDVLAQFAEFAKQFPLPRTIFLVAPEETVGALKSALSAAALSAFWLSDNPPAIISVLPGHVSGLIHVAAAAVPDLSLMLMALYGGQKELA